MLLSCIRCRQRVVVKRVKISKRLLDDLDELSDRLDRDETHLAVKLNDIKAKIFLFRIDTQIFRRLWLRTRNRVIARTIGSRNQQLRTLLVEQKKHRKKHMQTVEELRVIRRILRQHNERFVCRKCE